jgi:hypothetical protein
MNECLEQRAAVNRHAEFDHSALAELIARRWKQDRSYFTLNEKSRGAPLKASWWRQPGRSALELHWSHRALCIAHAGLLRPTQAAFDGAG